MTEAEKAQAQGDVASAATLGPFGRALILVVMAVFWTIVLVALKLWLTPRGIMIGHVPLAQVPLWQIAIAGFLLAVVLRVLTEQRRGESPASTAGGTVEVWTFEANGVVAVDPNENDPYQVHDVSCLPGGSYWYLFDLGEGELLCLSDELVATLQQEGAVQFPTSRLQIVRLPNNGPVIDVVCTGERLQPARCRSWFTANEYHPGAGGEIFSGTLATLDADLARLKVHPE
jgi:hypothetical protein